MATVQAAALPGTPEAGRGAASCERPPRPHCQPMELKDVLGEIESDGANLVHERLLEWALTPPLWHADAVGGRPHGVIAGASRPIVPTVSEPAWSRLLLFRSCWCRETVARLRVLGCWRPE